MTLEFKSNEQVSLTRPLSEDAESGAGYLHPGYVESLAEFGVPRRLACSGGTILVRQIPGFPDQDAMGTYPLFACRDWSKLNIDLEEIQDELVSLSVVTDPFGDYSVTGLQACFRDLVLAYKEHFVADLRVPTDGFISKHHRRYAQKALKKLQVEKCENAGLCLNQWTRLYANLVDRHGIKGISAFSEEAFARQLALPGMVAFRALHDGETVGMLLWYIDGDVGYYHLGAHSQVGYELRASFALFWLAIQYFGEKGIRWLDLGAGAGCKSDASDGLTRFKKGWSTGTRTAYFCGTIFDHTKYAHIVRQKGISGDDYFPAYRMGEFR